MEEYESLSKKYSLPAYGELNHLFEISGLEEKEFLLREIRRHISDKLKSYTDILEDLIHPNSTVSAYHELKFISEEDKGLLFDMYAKLMKRIRASTLLDLKHEDEEDAAYINDIHSEWPEIQQKLVMLMTKLRDSWSKEEIADSSLSSYLG